MALLVRKMNKFMKKKGNKEYVRRCYKCKSLDHVVVDCPYNSDNDEDEKKHKKEKKEKKKKKEKKITFTKKKKESGYVVTWDSNGTSDDDDGSSDDDKKSIKKALESITINNKPSLFDTPLTYLMAKPTKVKYDVSDNDACESDDYRSDDEEEEEYTKEELMDMLEQVNTCFEIKRKECKKLRKVKSLEQSFDELNASHESLREDYEELGKAHTKLEKAHSSLIEQVKKEEAKKEQVIVSYDVGLICDILDESFYKPIVVAPINPSCSTTTSTSPLSGGFTSDASLMVENETLKKEVNELTCALGKYLWWRCLLAKVFG
jgi:hypothetical protein